MFADVQKQLTILEPSQHCVKVFSTFEEFNTWYYKHKDMVDPQTTHILNKKYSIPGYWITKIKGVLSLKRVKPETNRCKATFDAAVNGTCDGVDFDFPLRANLDALIVRVTHLEKVFDQVVDALNAQNT